MVTKDKCPLLLKDKQNNDINDGQYNNFTLNKNHQISSDAFSGRSKSVAVERKEVLDYAKLIKRTATPTKLSDFANETDSQTKKETHSWNKSTKDLPPCFNNNGSGKEDNGLKKEKTLNASTLSLHIEAYENPNEADLFEKEGLKENGLIKKGLNAKQIYFDSTSVIQNAFEFSRQKENGEAENPEIAQFKASQRLLNPAVETQQVNLQQPLPQHSAGQTGMENGNEQKELDETPLSTFNILQISVLILVTLLHSFGILVIAFFFSVYQIFVSIFHIIKYCLEHPWHTRYGYEALKYAYYKEWWTFKGLYRWLTEPPPPPVFAQRTLSGEIKIDPIEAAKLEALRMKKMFHQKLLNGKFIPNEYVPPQNLELKKEN